MSPVGIEPTISVLERAKTVYFLDRTASGIGEANLNLLNCTEVHDFNGVSTTEELLDRKVAAPV
jgi:hypothetical protein